MRRSSRNQVLFPNNVHAKTTKSGNVGSLDDSFSKDNNFTYKNCALAQTMILNTSDISDYDKTPSFRSLNSFSETNTFLEICPQYNITVYPLPEKPEPRIDERAQKGSILGNLYWGIPVAVGALSLMIWAKR